MRPFIGLAITALIAAGAALGRAEPTTTEPPPQEFSHQRHSRLFPSCDLCHGGALVADSALFPTPTFCATCHDGRLQPQVTWSPPAGPRTSNLRFTHGAHRAAAAQRRPRALACIDCHADRGAPWMSVRLAAVPRCLVCHGITTPHYAAPDTACATCHLPLARAGRLTEDRIAGFPAPPSHGETGFADRGGHGLQADRPVAAPAPAGVAASCATCHARDFCVQCHVDAPEQAAIQALEPDPRSLVVQATLSAPASHETDGFLQQHGSLVGRRPAECRTCHTQESCLACHAGAPAVARGLAPPGPGRATGATMQRRSPPSHLGGFRDRHAAVAAAAPSTCAACHVRSDCLDCHRPDAASGSPGYHSADFLSRHPAAAYARESSCSDCHSLTAFCATCHLGAGLVAAGPIGRGYHDAKRFFIAGHGQAARQSLESCVACHTERDCLACHSALGGRRFNPHGPGFDPERLRKRNIEMCTACHGAAVPREN